MITSYIVSQVSEISPTYILESARARLYTTMSYQGMLCTTEVRSQISTWANNYKHTPVTHFGAQRREGLVAHNMI